MTHNICIIQQATLNLKCSCCSFAPYRECFRLYRENESKFSLSSHWSLVISSVHSVRKDVCSQTKLCGSGWFPRHIANEEPSLWEMMEEELSDQYDHLGSPCPQETTTGWAPSQNLPLIFDSITLDMMSRGNNSPFLLRVHSLQGVTPNSQLRV